MTVNKWDHGWDVWPLYLYTASFVQDCFRAKSELVFCTQSRKNIIPPVHSDFLTVAFDRRRVWTSGKINRKLNIEITSKLEHSGSPQKLLYNCTLTFYVIMAFDRYLCSGGQQSLWNISHKTIAQVPEQLKELFTYKWKLSHYTDGKWSHISGASPQNSRNTLLNTWRSWGLRALWCNPNLRKPSEPKLIWKDVIYALFKAGNFTVGVCANSFS